MGYFQDFFAALEAEDITAEVKNETQKAIGKSSVSTNSGTKPNIMKTDDILGTKSEDKKPSISSPNDTDDEDDSTIPTNNDDSLDDESDNDIDSDSDEDNSDFGNENDDDSVGTTDDIEKKKKLRENMILFYNIISENIKQLSEYIPNNSNKESNDIIYKVSSNLLECKTCLYTLITEDLSTGEYVDLLRKYVAINRVYDLCLQMLSKYFDNLQMLNSKGENKALVRNDKKSDKKE